jgi:hypothetical protein
MKSFAQYRKIPALLFLAMLFSCQEEINLDLNTPSNQRIVVEGRITNELQHHRIRLSRTLSYFNNQLAPPVLNAEVYIIEEGTGSRFNLSLVNDTMGYYETDMLKGKAGETYSLIVNDGDNSYKATSYLDTVAQIDSINYYYKYYSSVYEKQGFYIIRMSAFEPPPLGQVYMFYMYLNDTLYNNELVDTPYADDQFYNDTYLTNIEIYDIPQEEIKRDTNTFTLKMLSISKEEYNYNNTFLQETFNNGSVFSGPPANIPSNLKNTSGGLDGLGFFGASSVSTKTMMLYKEHNDSTNNPDYRPM